MKYDKHILVFANEIKEFKQYVLTMVQRDFVRKYIPTSGNSAAIQNRKGDLILLSYIESKAELLKFDLNDLMLSAVTIGKWYENSQTVEMLSMVKDTYKNIKFKSAIIEE